MSDTEGR